MKINMNFIGDEYKVNFGGQGGTRVMSVRKRNLMKALQDYFASQGQSLSQVGYANASNWMNEIYQSNNAVTDQEVLNQVAYWIINGR